MKSHHAVIEFPLELKKLQRLRDQYRQWARRESGWRPLARLASSVCSDLEEHFHHGSWQKSIESQVPVAVQRHLAAYFADLEGQRGQQREVLRRQILSLTSELDCLSTQHAHPARREVELRKKIGDKKDDLATHERPIDLNYCFEVLEFELGLKRQPRTPRLTHKGR
jgi:hypothetical protein